MPVEACPPWVSVATTAQMETEVPGLFAVGEVLVNVEKNMGKPLFTVPGKLRELLPTKADLRQSRLAIAMGSLLGFFVGALPGGGSTVASFLSYTLVKRTSRHPERFGKGGHQLLHR